MILNKPTVEERMDAFEEMVEAERQLLINKGHDYTAGNADADAYANFRIVSGLLDGAPVTPFTIALVYFMKHVLSIVTFAKSGKQESNESLKGRFNDIRNYAFILNELVPDHQQYFAEKELEEAFVAHFVNTPDSPEEPSTMIHVFGGLLPASEFEAAIKALKGAVDAALDERANEEFDCATQTGDCDCCDISEACCWRDCPDKVEPAVAPNPEIFLVTCSQYCVDDQNCSCCLEWISSHCCKACRPGGSKPACLDGVDLPLFFDCPPKTECLCEAAQQTIASRASSFDVETINDGQWKEWKRKEDLKNFSMEGEEEGVTSGINWPVGC